MVKREIIRGDEVRLACCLYDSSSLAHFLVDLGPLLQFGAL